MAQAACQVGQEVELMPLYLKNWQPRSLIAEGVSLLKELLGFFYLGPSHWVVLSNMPPQAGRSSADPYWAYLNPGQTVALLFGTTGGKGDLELGSVGSWPQRGCKAQVVAYGKETARSRTSVLAAPCLKYLGTMVMGQG